MKDLIAEHIERVRNATLEQALALQLERCAGWEQVNSSPQAMEQAPWYEAWCASREAWNTMRNAMYDSMRTASGMAGAALVTRASISEEHFETLVAPWVSVMGRTFEQ